MKSMRLWNLFVITTMVALLVTACGRAPTSTSGAASPAKKFNIVYVQGIATGSPYFTTLTCGAQAEAQRLGNVDFSFQGGQDYSAEAQTPVLNAVIAKKPDAIIISPIEGQAMVPPLTRAKQAGIKLVFADTTAPDASLAVSFIASDNTAGGRLAADNLAKLLGGKGKVMVEGTVPGISSTDQRLKGFEEQIKNYPDIQYVGAQGSDADPGNAASQISTVLSANPDLAGIFAVSPIEVEGAVTALSKAGLQGKVKVVGFDTSPSILDSLQAGIVQGLVVQEPLEMGRLAIDQAVDALTGQATTPAIATPFVFLTKDNMNDPNISKYIYKTSCQ
jgi:ribose transport system substrate-binding protein